MSEQNEKLTADQKAEALLTSFLNNVYKDTPKNVQPDFVYIHDSAVRKLMKTLMLMFYAQQVEHATAEMRDFLRQTEYKFEKKCNENSKLKKESAELRHKLEQEGDKKEAIISDTKAALYEATQQLTELRKECQRMMEVILSIFESGIVDRSDMNTINEIIADENRKGGTGAACYPIICSETEYEKLQKNNDELRKELDAAAKGLERWSNKWAKKNVETINLRSEIDNLKADKNLLNDQILVIKTHLADAQRQRDEGIYAMKELDRLKKEGSERESFLIALVEKLLGCGTFSPYDNVGVVKQAKEFLSRPSSGETKPVSTLSEVYPGSWCYPLFKHMSDEHGKILTDSELHDIVEVVRKMDEGSKPSFA